MRTRSQSNRRGKTPSVGEAEEDAVGGSKRRKAPAAAKGKSAEKVEPSLANRCKSKVKTKLHHDASVKQCTAGSNEQSKGEGEEVGTSDHDGATEMDWEEGHVSTFECEEGYSHELGKTVTVEFTDSPSSAGKKSSRRATAEEKELAELVHKVHLLCLLARGRIVDKACNDPLIQGSVLSLLPSHLLKIAEIPKLTANRLEPLVNWFHRTFRITPQAIDRGSFESNLAFALQSHEGTAEEVGALSVALFRALNLTARFVAILDVAALKPDAKVFGTSNQDAFRLDTRALTSTTTGASNNEVNTISPVHLQVGTKEDSIHRTLQSGNHGKRESTSSCKKSLSKSLLSCQSDDGNSCASVSAGKSCSDQLPSTSKNAEGSRRKGDLEFELQLEMALSATAAGLQDSKLDSQMDESTVSLPSFAPPLKKLRQTKTGEASSTGSSSAIWSRAGPPLYWAEVYCSGETLTGRWVHVDAADGVVDGEGKVEAASAVCRKPLKYVVAFAGNGAKDVTRRYCLQWYKIVPRRINPEWWEMVLEPLKQLELAATGGVAEFETTQEKAPSNLNLEENKANVQSPLGTNSNDQSNASSQGGAAGAAGGSNPESCSQPIQLNAIKPASQLHDYRHCLEDMELETRALTEPLPTNQQAYKNHHLYALERWLNKNQILHPKGPVLGYCSGHPVYPRSCVQTLQSRQRWLREGLQVRPNETPAKIVKRSKKFINVQSLESSAYEEDGVEPTMELYGKWQLEPLRLLPAVNGIVPKNERGQVEVWSEKCLPPGTVHLRLPRLVPVARRLEIDFASAMVGFEFRNGRSLPVFEGIVVCTEFKDAILEAYAEEEERRKAKERERDEAQALSRWYQLLSSIVTRQRLKNSYTAPKPGLSPEPLNDQNNHQSTHKWRHSEIEIRPRGVQIEPSKPSLPSPHDHEHVFPSEDQTFDEEMLVRTKRCPCGFSIQVEEL